MSCQNPRQDHSAGVGTSVTAVFGLFFVAVENRKRTKTAVTDVSGAGAKVRKARLAPDSLPVASQQTPEAVYSQSDAGRVSGPAVPYNG